MERQEAGDAKTVASPAFFDRLEGCSSDPDKEPQRSSHFLNYRAAG
jgi:hypothetical protein